MNMIIVCRRYRISLSAYLNGELDANVNRTLEKHLAGCPGCAAVLETFRKTIALCRDLPLLPVPAELHSKIMHRLETELKPHPLTLHLIVRRQVIIIRKRKKIGIKKANKNRKF